MTHHGVEVILIEIGSRKIEVIEITKLCHLSEVEDEIADAHAYPFGCCSGLKNTKWQVLDGEF